MRVPRTVQTLREWHVVKVLGNSVPSTEPSPLTLHLVAIPADGSLKGGEEGNWLESGPMPVGTDIGAELYWDMRYTSNGIPGDQGRQVDPTRVSYAQQSIQSFILHHIAFLHFFCQQWHWVVGGNPASKLTHPEAGEIMASHTQVTIHSVWIHNKNYNNNTAGPVNVQIDWKIMQLNFN